MITPRDMLVCGLVWSGCLAWNACAWSRQNASEYASLQRRTQAGATADKSLTLVCYDQQQHDNSDRASNTQLQTQAIVEIAHMLGRLVFAMTF